MNTRIIGLLLLTAYGSLLTSAPAQIPVTVSRSTINAGGTVTYPTYTWSGIFYAQAVGTFYLRSASYNAGASSVLYITNITVIATASDTLVSGETYWGTFTPFVVLSTEAPSVFTNTIAVAYTYSRASMDWPENPTPAGTYVITVIEDAGSAATAAAGVTLAGQADPLQGISRKETSVAPRKLLGFSLVANTNATLTSVAFALSNSTTNGNNFSSLALYRDADGLGMFDSGDTLLATTTNSGGFAIFSGLTEAISTSPVTRFLAASFQPTNQTRNSFLTASLNSQNLVALLATTNLAVAVSGGSVLGTQYAFLDTTVEEDVAAAAALSSQINAAVTGATNSLVIAYGSQLTQATNQLSASYANSLVLTSNALATGYSAQLAAATNGLGGTTVIDGSKKLDWTETILPAAAAGAAGVGAAFTLDSLNERPLSKEFQPKPSD